MTTTTLPAVERLDDDELETILIIARNRQSGRITEFEVNALVEAYRELKALRAPAKEPV